MKVENKRFDEERALYALTDAEVINCTFEGEADGESAMKESGNIKVKDCTFKLRYPFWHSRNYNIDNCTMTDTARAALWYCENGKITNCQLGGIKAVRECDNTLIKNCTVISPEFGWKNRVLDIYDSSVTSEYFLLDSKDVTLKNVKLTGKYSFQYTENVTVGNCVLDTKDAFWHTKNAVIKDSVVNGEYLAWYSENLTFINCKISGTQPFCYCKNLKLINCTMENADLSFEYSDVDADIKGELISVKNPRSGKIVCDGVGEMILENAVMECNCEIVIR